MRDGMNDILLIRGLIAHQVIAPGRSLDSMGTSLGALCDWRIAPASAVVEPEAMDKEHVPAGRQFGTLEVLGIDERCIAVSGEWLAPNTVPIWQRRSQTDLRLDRLA